ncbi:MAG: hypothetical protein GX640_23520 [Fibrobacter sp.]|nr:hypothetical protein [Fibrobacter sp.]
MEKCLQDACSMGVLDINKVKTVNVLDIPYGYVLFDHNRKNAVHAIRQYLEGIGIFSAGRFGSWDYFSMEDAFFDGWNAATKLSSRIN